MDRTDYTEREMEIRLRMFRDLMERETDQYLKQQATRLVYETDQEYFQLVCPEVTA